MVVASSMWIVVAAGQNIVMHGARGLQQLSTSELLLSQVPAKHSSLRAATSGTVVVFGQVSVLQRDLHAAVDDRLRVPVGQTVQSVAPTAERVFVTESAGQAVHATVEVPLYFPASHAVQPVCPTDDCTEPAVQVVHAT